MGFTSQERNYSELYLGIGYWGSGVEEATGAITGWISGNFGTIYHYLD